MSIVADIETVRGPRKLPTLYFGKAPLTTTRSASLMRDRLQRVVSVVAGAIDEPTYLLTACRTQGRTGVYGWDVHDRSRVRRSLERLDVEFTEPFLRLEDGKFVSREWGEFHPDFFIFRAQDPDDPHRIVKSSHAAVVFLAAASRLGLVPASELPQLRAALSSARTVAAGDPAAIASAITT